MDYILAPWVIMTAFALSDSNDFVKAEVKNEKKHIYCEKIMIDDVTYNKIPTKFKKIEKKF